MRYNIFNQVHRPLKEVLLSACIALSAKREWTVSSAVEAIRKVEEALAICDEQVKYEAMNVMPFVFEYEPSIWNLYTSEHHKVMNQWRDLKSLIHSFYKEKGVENRGAIISLIRDSFNEFMLLNYNHMDDEEAVLNEILWRYYSDNVIMEMEKTLHVKQGSLRKQKREMEMAEAA